MTPCHFVCRLIDQLTAILEPVASSTAPPAVAAAAAAAEASAHDAETAAVAAASRLATFFPQTHLLRLTQTALSCVQPDSHPDISTEGSRQGHIATLGLDLAEALIGIWTEKEGGSVASKDLHRDTGQEEEDWDQGGRAVWGNIVTGLLRMALSRGATTGADELLLKALRKSNTASLDR